MEEEANIGTCLQGEIILWDMATRQAVGELLTGIDGTVESLVFSPDGKMLRQEMIETISSCGM